MAGKPSKKNEAKLKAYLSKQYDTQSSNRQDNAGSTKPRTSVNGSGTKKGST